MNTERIDTVNNHFKLVGKAEIVSKVLFYSSLAVSFAMLFTKDHEELNQWTNKLLILFTFLYFILSNIITLYLLRGAQNTRRTQLLSNAFDMALDEQRTRGYYNNDKPPSLLRLGWNVFENTFFTRATVAVQLKTELPKAVAALTLFIVLLVFEERVIFLAFVTQTLFTSNVLLNAIKLVILYCTCDRLFKEFQIFFITHGDRIEGKLQALLLKHVTDYETEIAGMRLHIPDSVFDQIAPRKAQQWEDIKKEVARGHSRFIGR